MASAGFVAELYLSKDGSHRLSELAARARAAADQMAQEGTPIRYCGAVFLPDDETCFCLYEATSAEAVAEASRRASIPFDRVVPMTAESGI